MRPDVLELMAEEITRAPVHAFALAFGWQEGWAVTPAWEPRELGDAELLAAAEREARSYRPGSTTSKPKPLRRNRRAVVLLSPEERRRRRLAAYKRTRKNTEVAIRMRREERRRWLALLGW